MVGTVMPAIRRTEGRAAVKQARKLRQIIVLIRFLCTHPAIQDCHCRESHYSHQIALGGKQYRNNRLGVVYLYARVPRRSMTYRDETDSHKLYLWPNGPLKLIQRTRQIQSVRFITTPLGKRIMNNRG